jgi:hypothetical protein
MRLGMILACALIMAPGCGGDKGDGSSTTTASGGGASATPRPEGDAGVVYDTVLAYETTPACDLLTDKLLDKLAVLGDTPEEKCRFAREGLTRPPANVVQIRNVQVSGTTATAEVPAIGVGGATLNIGDKLAVEYLKLVKQGDVWKVDESELDPERP